jgi:drug/metabolite transporter (DMT)-like permease
MLLYPFIISIVWGIVPIILKLFLSIIPHEFIMLISSITLFISTVIYTVFFNYHKVVEGYSNITLKFVLLLIITFFIASFICQLLYLKTLKNYNPNIPVLIIASAPIITIIASYYILNDKLKNIQLFGCVLIFIGLYLLLKYKN